MAPVTPPEIFPNEIWEEIFSHLRDADSQTLKDCRETCRYFTTWVNTKTAFWNRMSLKRAVEENSVDTCRQILLYAKDKNPRGYAGVTPLDLAAKKGHLEICRLIMDNVHDKNPLDNRGNTPQDRARRGRHHEVARLFENL